MHRGDRPVLQLRGHLRFPPAARAARVCRVSGQRTAGPPRDRGPDRARDTRRPFRLVRSRARCDTCQSSFRRGTRRRPAADRRRRPTQADRGVMRSTMAVERSPRAGSRRRCRLGAYVSVALGWSRSSAAWKISLMRRQRSAVTAPACAQARASQARAIVQCRFTVAGEVPTLPRFPRR